MKNNAQQPTDIITELKKNMTIYIIKRNIQQKRRQ